VQPGHPSFTAPTHGERQFGSITPLLRTSYDGGNIDFSFPDSLESVVNDRSFGSPLSIGVVDVL
jgi:hypothetical protein